MSPVKTVKPAVRLFGKKGGENAITLVNSELARQFRDSVRRVTHAPAVFLHHDYRFDFKKIKPPRAEKRVAFRSWDFGRFPATWVERIHSDWDELWVYSRWVRDNAVKSGVPRARVKVMPLGVDPKIFSPTGPTYAVPTGKSFRFLFVGGAVHRKGVDLLLRAYARAFRKSDDVALVIKDFATNPFYRRVHQRAEIHELRKRRGAPEIVYVDEFLTKQSLAALYRSCAVGVFPYRAEGFGLPILECLASGTFVVVPNFGASRDYCPPTRSRQLPVRRMHFSVGKKFAINGLGFEERVDEVDFCEVAVDDLAENLRELYERRAEFSVRDVGAARRFGETHAWERRARRMVDRFGELTA